MWQERYGKLPTYFHITCVLKSIWKKNILKHFSNFERKNNITDSEYGFRRGFSTESALVTQKEYILDNSEKGNTILVILIFHWLIVGFSRTFDIINHDLLIRKLKKYGFRGVAASLIRSYLQYRKQIVDIEGFYSDPLAVFCGVPQGSILGSFLFIFT